MCMFLLGTGGPQIAQVHPIPIEPYTSTHAHYTLTQSENQTLEVQSKLHTRARKEMHRKGKKRSQNRYWF